MGAEKEKFLRAGVCSVWYHVHPIIFRVLCWHLHGHHSGDSLVCKKIMFFFFTCRFSDGLASTAKSLQQRAFQVSGTLDDTRLGHSFTS